MKHPLFPTTVLCLALAGQVFGAKTIPNNAIADLVIGQPDFVTATVPGTPSSFSLNSPTAVVIDPVSRKVFVADQANSRVLRYPNVTTLANGGGAEAVFGQNRFSTGTSGSGDQGLSDDLRGLFFDRFGRLWVSDRDNNRVLMFEAASYRETGAFADRVFGQPDFATSTSGTTATKMKWPQGVWVDSADRLWVADYSNNRVLRFDNVSSKASGASADGVLGQANFTTSASGSGSSGLNGPVGVAVSQGGELFVGTDNRVMRFDNAASLGNGAGANVVLGQPDFATTSSGLSTTKMANPSGVWITPDDTLWVCDCDNNRFLRFTNASSKASGSAADGVVGQANFTANVVAVTNRGIGSYPFFQPFVDAAGSLWIPDTSNNRVLRFPPDLTNPLLVVTSSVPKTVTNKKITIKGTASDAYGISRVQYMIGTGPLKTATGTTNWQFTANLEQGKNKITLFAVDAVGNKSTSKIIKVKREAKNAPAMFLTSGD